MSLIFSNLFACGICACCKGALPQWQSLARPVCPPKGSLLRLGHTRAIPQAACVHTPPGMAPAGTAAVPSAQQSSLCPSRAVTDGRDSLSPVLCTLGLRNLQCLARSVFFPGPLCSMGITHGLTGSESWSRSPSVCSELPHFLKLWLWPAL